MWTADGAGIQKQHVESASEFVALLRRSHPTWWEGDSMPWAFRGHADENWLLLPSAWRAGNPIIEAGRRESEKRLQRLVARPVLKWIFPPTNLVSGEVTFGSGDEVFKKQLVIEANAEILPLFDFLLRCNERGVNTPMVPAVDPDIDVSWLHNHVYPLLADEFFYYSDIPQGLALAQHHGLPTRLLDWTLNPAAALFFSVEKIRTPSADKNIVVWAFHRTNSTHATIRGAVFPQTNGGAVSCGVRVFRPSIRDNPYLAAQSGLFTCIGGSGIHFMQNDGARPPLDAFIRETNVAVPVLRKITISQQHVPEIADILRKESVSRAAFMPTADNISTDVQRRWTQRFETA